MEPKRLTAVELRRKGRGSIVALTAYTAPAARALDAHVDLLLVGDSLGMVLYGMESTLPVSLPLMIAHGAAVVAASRKALVAVDLPFGSYQQSPAHAFASAAEVMAKTGCGAVKLEGGMEMAETVRFLVERGIPVLGHVGMKPQHMHTHGGFRAVGRSASERERVLADARAIEEAGAFAIVIESVEEKLARTVTEALRIPVIGIGASPACDGQVLVTEDMMGLSPRTPRFVKRYAALAEAMSKAAAEYAEEVRSGKFPAPEHCYSVRPKP